jgi:hypothetical protein
MRIVARSTSHSGMSTLSQPSVEHRIEGTARSGVNSASAADFVSEFVVRNWDSRQVFGLSRPSQQSMPNALANCTRRNHAAKLHGLRSGSAQVWVTNCPGEIPLVQCPLSLAASKVHLTYHFRSASLKLQFFYGYSRIKQRALRDGTVAPAAPKKICASSLRRRQNDAVHQPSR